MEFLTASCWDEALAIKAEHPEAVPIQGGTDVMVELNFDTRRPAALLDLNQVGELTTWETTTDTNADPAAGEVLRVGAGVPYARLTAELGGQLPALTQAARTVGSPQIRNRGTVGGNLGTASPAGDCHPALVATGARIEVESAARGVRMIDATDFYTGVKRNALAADELIRAFHVAPATAPQYFAKIGTRNAMVIAVCTFAIALYPDQRSIGTGIGSAAPTPLRATAAEEYLAAAVDWDAPLPPAVPREFGALVAGAARPIDDVRGSADYRRTALGVLARRTLTWAWEERMKEVERCA